MMSRLIRRILKIGPFIADVVMSGAGCFVFTRGFRVAAMGQERPDTRSSMRAGGKSTTPLEGIGAALFLLAFVASEAAATIVAFRR
jgi:hypothetical protein